MPEMDGVELAKRAEQIRKDEKIVVISGRHENHNGFAMLCKPFDQNALRRTVQQTVGLG
jgi:YesN/AraC family two-component response regulator